MLLPRWFFFHLDKVSYWSRTVMVPLFILCTRKPLAKNPRNVHIRELFTRPPEVERHYFRDSLQQGGVLGRILLVVDRLARLIDPLIPKGMRARATRAAEQWMLDRLNGEDGLGAIFPAMVNALEAMTILGYASDDPRRVTAKRALQKLLVIGPSSAYCQPCVSPVWDTGLAALAMQESGCATSRAAATRALDWLQTEQLLDEPGDWRVNRPGLAGGGWAFQFGNSHYPDLDDTAVVAWAMHQSANSADYSESVRRALDWLVGMQSAEWRVCRVRCRQYLSLLEQDSVCRSWRAARPPDQRCHSARGDRPRAHRPSAGPAGPDAVRSTICATSQEPDGSWFGRWGTNYIYGTWSVLTALAQAGVESAGCRRAPRGRLAHEPAKRRWRLGREQRQLCRRARGWSESARARPTTRRGRCWRCSLPDEAGSDAVRRGVNHLMRTQQADGLWSDPNFNAPGFPRVFYLKYHGYSRYFPLWALAAFRTLTRAGTAH